jgi:hypothetical protein
MSDISASADEISLNGISQSVSDTRDERSGGNEPVSCLVGMGRGRKEIFGFSQCELTVAEWFHSLFTTLIFLFSYHFMPEVNFAQG